MYPTAAKLAAALGFAALGWAASRLVAPNLPERLEPGIMAEVNAAIGLVLGWRISGRAAGRGMADALGTGLTTGISLLVVSIAVWAGYEMWNQVLALRYDGPLDGFEGMIELIIDYARMIWPGPALPALAAGSLAVGALTEVVARRAAR